MRNIEYYFLKTVNYHGIIEADEEKKDIMRGC